MGFTEGFYSKTLFGSSSLSWPSLAEDMKVLVDKYDLDVPSLSTAIAGDGSCVCLEVERVVYQLLRFRCFLIMRVAESRN